MTHGTITYRNDRGRKMAIGLSEIDHVKYGNRMWTIFKLNQTFVSFRASDLVGGFNHLTKLVKFKEE